MEPANDQHHHCLLLKVSAANNREKMTMLTGTFLGSLALLLGLR